LPHGDRDRDVRVVVAPPPEESSPFPGATLRLYDGVGHPVAKTHKRRFEDDVLGFLHG
jgi:hypothetical protein